MQIYLKIILILYAVIVKKNIEKNYPLWTCKNNFENAVKRSKQNKTTIS